MNAVALSFFSLSPPLPPLFLCNQHAMHAVPYLSPFYNSLSQQPHQRDVQEQQSWQVQSPCPNTHSPSIFDSSVVSVYTGQCRSVGWRRLSSEGRRRCRRRSGRTPSGASGPSSTAARGSRSAAGSRRRGRPAQRRRVCVVGKKGESEGCVCVCVCMCVYVCVCVEAREKRKRTKERKVTKVHTTCPLSPPPHPASTQHSRVNASLAFLTVRDMYGTLQVKLTAPGQCPALSATVPLCPCPQRRCSHPHRNTTQTPPDLIRAAEDTALESVVQLEGEAGRPSACPRLAAACSLLPEPRRRHCRRAPPRHAERGTRAIGKTPSAP